MNNKWLKVALVILLVALLAVGAIAAYAQGPRGGQTGGPGNSLVAVAAEVIGIEQTELVAELQNGLTIAEVAEAHDVAVQDIVDAFVATRAERLTSGVEAGRLTQEQADLMLSNMEAHVTLMLSQPFGTNGMGFMGSRGHMGGHGMGSRMHQGMGPGGGIGPGMGFNDADGDGFCDNCPLGAVTGNGV
jgi:hypothetical protein